MTKETLARELAEEAFPASRHSFKHNWLYESILSVLRQYGALLKEEQERNEQIIVRAYEDKLTTLRQRIAELEKERDDARSAIRLHRDQRGHDRCHLDDINLYAALPEGQQGSDLTLPPQEEFIAGCKRFWNERKSGVSFEHCSLVEVLKARDTALAALATITKERDALRKALEHWQHVWTETDCEHDDCMSAFDEAKKALES